MKKLELKREAAKNRNGDQQSPDASSSKLRSKMGNSCGRARKQAAAGIKKTLADRKLASHKERI